jgi:hypothetical protein
MRNLAFHRHHDHRDEAYRIQQPTSIKSYNELHHHTTPAGDPRSILWHEDQRDGILEHVGDRGLQITF